MSQEQPQYFSRSELLAVLEENIEQLQRLQARVSQESPSTWPDNSILDDLQTTARRLQEAVQIHTTPVTHGIDDILPDLDSLDNWWDQVLARVRSLLPVSWREQLSDWALTSIITGLLVAVLLGAVTFLQPQASPTPSPEVVQIPEPVGDIFLEEEEEETPPELVAPELPQEVVLQPLPEPVRTPEQKLLLALQEALNDLVKQYPEGMIQGIQADFGGSRLLVTLGEGWYSLSSKRQDRLADYIWQRSQRLDFKNLELLNSEKDPLARNPVVGDKMIILNRER
jgi:hypothetical protein